MLTFQLQGPGNDSKQQVGTEKVQKRAVFIVGVLRRGDSSKSGKIDSFYKQPIEGEEQGLSMRQSWLGKINHLFAFQFV